MKASEAIREIIARDSKIPGRPALVVPLEAILTNIKKEIAFISLEDLEKALIAVEE